MSHPLDYAVDAIAERVYIAPHPSTTEERREIIKAGLRVCILMLTDVEGEASEQDCRDLFLKNMRSNHVVLGVHPDSTHVETATAFLDRMARECYYAARLILHLPVEEESDDDTASE